jgi:uncharacterized protein YegP (UPF0339 family)
MILKSYYEVYQGKDHLFYWRLYAPNHRQVADGSEGYSTKQGAERGIISSIRQSTGLVAKWEAGAKYGNKYSMRWLRIAATSIPVRYPHP